MLEADSFTTRLGAAIDAQELTLGRLAARLEAAGTPVPVSTLSLWRAGRVKPQRNRSLSAVEELERILRLQPGFLVSCVDEERRGPQHASERPSGIRVWAIPQVARDKLLAELGDDVPTGSDVIGRHEILTLDARGRLTSVQSTLTLRITDDHAWRLIIGALSDTVDVQGPVLSLPSVHFGGSLGRIVEVGDMGLVAFDIVFDEEVHTGDVMALSYDIAPEHLDWMPVEPDLGGRPFLPSLQPTRSRHPRGSFPCGQDPRPRVRQVLGSQPGGCTRPDRRHRVAG